MPKMFSWGAARVRMPSATLVIRRAARIGSEICRPAEKMRLPQARQFQRRAPATAACRHRQAGEAFRQRREQHQVRVHGQEGHGRHHRHELADRDRYGPACSDRRRRRSRSPSSSWPVRRRISMAANTRRIAKPIARPISSSCTRIRRPAYEVGSTAGIGGTVGAMISGQQHAEDDLDLGRHAGVAEQRGGRDQAEDARQRPQQARDPGLISARGEASASVRSRLSRPCRGCR